MAGMLGSRKVWQIFRTWPNFNQPNGILMAKKRKLFLPTTFNLAIYQTLMLLNIPIIQYTVETLPWPLLEW